MDIINKCLQHFTHIILVILTILYFFPFSLAFDILCDFRRFNVFLLNPKLGNAIHIRPP